MTTQEKKKLSKLIKKGFDNRGEVKHITEKFFEFEDGKLTGACALGFLIMAEMTEVQFKSLIEEYDDGEENSDLFDEALTQLGLGYLKDLTGTKFKCPSGDCYGSGDHYTGHLFGIIPHLNDGHKWSIDQVVEWIDEQEKQAALATPA